MTSQFCTIDASICEANGKSIIYHDSNCMRTSDIRPNIRLGECGVTHCELNLIARQIILFIRWFLRTIYDTRAHLITSFEDVIFVDMVIGGVHCMAHKLYSHLHQWTFAEKTICTVRVRMLGGFKCHGVSSRSRPNGFNTDDSAFNVYQWRNEDHLLGCRMQDCVQDSHIFPLSGRNSQSFWVVQHCSEFKLMGVQPIWILFQVFLCWSVDSNKKKNKNCIRIHVFNDEWQV